MKSVILIFVLFYSQFSLGQKSEIETFFSDIFHDSTIYSNLDFIKDSTELSKDDFYSKTCPDCMAGEIRLLLNRIDSNFTNFRIDNGQNYVHLQRLIIVSSDKSRKKNSANIDESIAFEILTSDSILNYPSKFDRANANANLSQYLDYSNSFVFNNSAFKCETINSKNIEKYNWNWSEFYGKYGGIYFDCSIPMFNHNYDFAYFTFTINTYGVGKSYSGIYEKKNGNWLPIIVLGGIITTNNWR